MTVVAPAPGQKWVRNSSGDTVEIVAVGPAWDARRHVVTQGKRTVHTEYGPFLRKYTLVDTQPTPGR